MTEAHLLELLQRVTFAVERIANVVAPDAEVPTPAPLREFPIIEPDSGITSRDVAGPHIQSSHGRYFLRRLHVLPGPAGPTGRPKRPANLAGIRGIVGRPGHPTDSSAPPRRTPPPATRPETGPARLDLGRQTLPALLRTRRPPLPHRIRQAEHGDPQRTLARPAGRLLVTALPATGSGTSTYIDRSCEATDENTLSGSTAPAAASKAASQTIEARRAPASDRPHRRVEHDCTAARGPPR
jgi:hypothetical protein